METVREWLVFLDRHPLLAVIIGSVLIVVGIAGIMMLFRPGKGK